MKTVLSITSIAALAFSGSLSAQTAYSKPSGYTTQTLRANSINLVGINLLKPIVVSGNITNVTGTVITDTNQNFSTLLQAGKAHILEITSGVGTIPATTGTAAGAVQWFVNWSGNTITIPNSVILSGVSAGDRYTVRLAPTLQELFPVGTLAGFGLNSALNADKVWVPQGNGVFIKYAYKTGTSGSGPGWYTTQDGAVIGSIVTADIPILTTDGLYVEKKNLAGNLTIAGEIKTTSSNSRVTPGFNLVSINPPAGSTFLTCGLSISDVATFGLNNALNADKIWIQQSDGSFTRYAYRTGTSGAGPGWYTTPDGARLGSLVTTDFPLPAAILIERKATSPINVTFDVPATYSNL